MKRVYRKEEGIASTVGTIFALMIFTALLGMFMTQVVPVTMKENEAEHDQIVLSQLSNLRSVIDILTMTKDTNYTAYVPIKLGSEGIPFFATPTYGQLSLYPSTPPASKYMMSLKFVDKFGNEIYRNSSGSLQFISPNKYYDAEVFEYANGAILRYNYKSGGAIFAIDPNIKFENQAMGYAVAVNGSASPKDYIRVPNNASSLNPTRITVELWFNLQNVPTSYRALLSKWNSYQILVRNNRVQFRIYDGGWHSVSAATTVSPNKWYHIAGTYDGHELRIYLNGNLLATNAYNGAIASSTSNIYIGSGTGIVGLVDEVRILNLALSDTAIQDDYLAGPHYPNRAGTVLWLHLDEGTGRTAVDSSGNHNDGRLLNNAYWVARQGVNVVVTLQNIFGTPDMITGTETRSIGVSLQGISVESYDIGGSLNITVRDYYRFTSSFSFNFTKHWISMITDMLNNSGLHEGVDYVVSGDTISIFSVETAHIRMVYVVMQLER